MRFTHSIWGLSDCPSPSALVGFTRIPRATYFTRGKNFKRTHLWSRADGRSTSWGKISKTKCGDGMVMRRGRGGLKNGAVASRLKILIWVLPINIPSHFPPLRLPPPIFVCYIGSLKPEPIMLLLNEKGLGRDWWKRDLRNSKDKHGSVMLS